MLSALSINKLFWTHNALRNRKGQSNNFLESIGPSLKCGPNKQNVGRASSLITIRDFITNLNSEYEKKTTTKMNGCWLSLILYHKTYQNWLSTGSKQTIFFFYVLLVKGVDSCFEKQRRTSELNLGAKIWTFRYWSNFQDHSFGRQDCFQDFYLSLYFGRKFVRLVLHA